MKQSPRIWLNPLTTKVRAFELSQIACYYCCAKDPRRAAKQAILRYEKAGKIVSTIVMSRVPIRLDKPLFNWKPGDTEPKESLFGHLSWTGKNRIKNTVKELLLVQALPLNRTLRRHEILHDLLVAGLYQEFEKNQPEFAKNWISEGALKAAGFEEKYSVLPDAMVTDKANEPVAIDVIGTAYSKSKIANLHTNYNKAQIAYALY